jgi:metal-responsive CopG/Arc/MetJ family transcriptional regulator
MAKNSQPERVIMPISQDLLDRIEEFRWAVRAPSRAEAMRALMEEGLANQERAAERVERDARK